MKIFTSHRRFVSCLAPFVLLVPVCYAAESFVAPATGTLYVRCVGGNAGAASQFGTGTSIANFTPLLSSVPQSCPTTEVAAGHVVAGEKVPFGIHTVWQGLDYFAFSSASDQPSTVAFSDVYNSLGMGGKVIQQSGINTWVMHLNDAAHYTVALEMANNILIQIRLAPDDSPAPLTVAPVADEKFGPIDGKWSATFTDTKATGQLEVSLIQSSDGRVSGAYTSSLSGNGRIEGAVAGAKFSFEMTQAVEGCSGVYKGEGVRDGDRITGSYSGSDCSGVRADGRFMMAKARVIQPPRPNPSTTASTGPPPTEGSFVVTAVGYRVIPHERTSYYTVAGHSNTNCYGSGTYFGNSVSGSVNCSTVTTPPQSRSMRIRSIEVYNQVEASGMIYTIRCSANWFGSSCSWLTPGDNFSAEVKGRDMWITARKGGNLGKEIHAKYQMLDRRPKT